ncbi:MAG TPA: hypothetical protein VH141_33455 [Pseudonocardia sp.]|jgi:hypothetical protein|nr:hypothetical protein [Pseudonocardia sp.]
MTAVSGPGQEILGRAAELIEQTLTGAKANARPDLIRRLDRARRALDAVGGSDSGSVEEATPETAEEGTAERKTRAVRLAAEEALRALDSLGVDLRSRRALLSDEDRVGGLTAELREAKAYADRCRQRSREWSHVLAHGFARLGSDVEFDVRTRIRGLAGELEIAAETGDPRRVRAELDTRLRGHLVAEAERTYAFLYAGVCRVAAEVATDLELPAPHRVPPLLVIPPGRLVAQLPDRYRPAPGRPPLARLLGVLLPGYTGMVITLVLSRALGLQLSGWLIAAFALVGAVALSGAKASVERGRQLDRRRAELTKALRGTGEEFQLALLKQVRDALRTLQHDLRRATTHTVTHREQAIAEELDVLRTAADAVRRAPAELAAITKDLRTLDELHTHARELHRATTPPPVADQPPSRRPLTAVA